MNVTTKTLGRKVLLKARDLQTTSSLLLCALQVIAINQDSVNILDNKVELDGYISHALTKHFIGQFTLKAKNNLMSKDSAKVAEACKDIEIVNETTLDGSPYYKAYKRIIKSIIQEAPLMHLHIKAVETVAELIYQFKSHHKKATITEVVLNECKEEIVLYSNLILMESFNCNNVQMTNAFAA